MELSVAVFCRTILCRSIYIGHRNNAIHLHGHSHNTEEHFHELEIAELLRQKGYTPRIVNVGCMHWNYEPVTLDEILAKYPM